MPYVKPRTLTLALVLLALTSCGKVADEAIEAALCNSATDKICSKWFSCWPVVSAGLWTSEADCQTVMDAYCRNTEAIVGCDIDNDRMRDCDSQIASSPCGSVPSSCTLLLDCYKTTQ